jgi:hypothetical protein
VRTKLTAVALGALGLFGACAPAFAHHGNAAYDYEKSVVVKGVVTEYIWANPHVFLKVDAKDENGNVQHWLIEAQNPVAQANAGWTKITFKPGDQVDLDVMPTKNGQPIGRFRNRIVINGQVFKGEAPR